MVKRKSTPAFYQTPSRRRSGKVSKARPRTPQTAPPGRNSRPPRGSQGPSSVEVQASKRGRQQEEQDSSRQKLLFHLDEADENELQGTPTWEASSSFFNRAAGGGGSLSLSDLAVQLEELAQLPESREVLPPKSAAAVCGREDRLRRSFPDWHMQLKCGFNLLFHGEGCKRLLLAEFAAQQLTDAAVVQVNGLSDRVPMKQLLLTIASLASGQPPTALRGASTAGLLRKLRTFTRPVYVVILNLDGPGLCGNAEQQLLSQMAACSAVRMSACVDHVNAALLWDRAMASRFGWVWHDAGSLRPYLEATRHQPPVLSGKATSCTKQSALTVLRTLVPNAQKVFSLLGEKQLEEGGAGVQGLPFTSLYRLSRECFLLSSEITLKMHLTEFKDHHLLQKRRGPDATELLSIPMPPDVLRQLLDDLHATT